MPPPSAEKTPVTLRVIAAQLRLSSATVSLALRGHPRITPQTCMRVRAAAEALGYRPDPQVARLMQHLRVRRPARFQATLCALTTLTAEQELPYVRALAKSVQLRAQALGYRIDVMRLRDAAVPRLDLERILRSRGIEGLVLLPMLTARDFTPLIDWSRFTVVAATNAVRAPGFHRVTPHHFANMRMLCVRLAERGYRRIGLVIPAAYDRASLQAFSAALLRHNLPGEGEPVMPLLYESLQPAELARWFHAVKPDALVVPSAREARAILKQLALRIPGPVGVAVMTEAGDSPFAGLDEQPDKIGSDAVRLLASLLQNGERGVPTYANLTMVPARWVEGRSIRAATSSGREQTSKVNSARA